MLKLLLIRVRLQTIENSTVSSVNSFRLFDQV